MQLRKPFAALMTLLAVLAPRARADWLTDGMLANPQLLKTVKTVGFFCLSGMKTDAQLTQDKSEVQSNVFWAFQPDAHLTEDELALNTRAFDHMWDGLIATSKLFRVTQVDFVGVDTLSVSTQSMDLYYLATTPRGPVLFRYSMEFRVGNYARLMNFETVVQWDKIKEITKAIGHPIDHEKIPTISWPSRAAGTQPSTDRDRTAG